ncbi:hypothetical protein HWV62_41767 [Athelia sp. TMB]|nr:hypothetical protein HWV62_41767 [Athelia sp. TMB]
MLAGRTPRQNIFPNNFAPLGVVVGISSPESGARVDGSGRRGRGRAGAVRECAARLVDACAREADYAVEGVAPYFYGLLSHSLAPRPAREKRNGAHLEGGEPEDLDAAALELGDLCVHSNIFFSDNGSAGMYERKVAKDTLEK